MIIFYVCHAYTYSTKTQTHTDLSSHVLSVISDHHLLRWVLCANHTEPVKGFLGRFLRRKLIETEIAKNMRSNDLIKIIDWVPKTWQHLNSFLEAHSSSDVTIGNTHNTQAAFDLVILHRTKVRYLFLSLLGPRLFLSCPMDADGSRVWFTDLWNYSLVPYLLEAVREGLQVHMQPHTLMYCRFLS